MKKLSLVLGAMMIQSGVFGSEQNLTNTATETKAARPQHPRSLIEKTSSASAVEETLLVETEKLENLRKQLEAATKRNDVLRLGLARAIYAMINQITSIDVVDAANEPFDASCKEKIRLEEEIRLEENRVLEKKARPDEETKN